MLYDALWEGNPHIICVYMHTNWKIVQTSGKVDTKLLKLLVFREESEIGDNY
jgi:hypothetical protein